MSVSVEATHAHERATLAPSARFVIVDDHPLMVEAVMSRVRALSRGAVFVYTGVSIFEAVRHAQIHGCDCAVVGLDLRGSMSAAEIVTAFSMHGIPVIALAEQASVEGFEEAFVAGARGYVGKRSDPGDIAIAAAAVLEGRSFASEEFVRRTGVRSSAVALSAQERRSLVLYASGMTQQLVARRMGIAPSTVKHYLDRVRQKYTEAGYPARTKIELHAITRREGWLP